ncbi:MULTISPECIES: sigma factor-like helix-turn-helix DNA-binding protein [unclassified Streptomyces]|uniref:sigma factor-like helix-turn-helix DNA-binding protein n=1 Tax=unclassified Streptomyces TaxID=2593676 RepID=UPI003331E5EA
MDTYIAPAGQVRERSGPTADPLVGDLEGATSVFVRDIPGLLKIAGRIVGNANEAEDVVQEAWLRWQGTDRTVVLNPSALLRTTTARLAINVVQSAWRRRESCATPWLPERTDIHETPEVLVEQQDAVEEAVLLLMERLTPSQRAAYVLREGFGYPYDRISELLRLTVPNARQLNTRAHQRLAADRGRQPVDAAAHRRLVQAFLAAARSGDTAQLEDVLAADAARDRCGPARPAVRTPCGPRPG